jgi:serine/threonine-protein kinase
MKRSFKKMTRSRVIRYLGSVPKRNPKTVADPLLGLIIGERYQLTHVVGQGGMGIVYRAEDVRLNGRPCAVKLLTGRSIDPEEVERFERELHIISRLRSQHVVQVLDAGALDDGRRFIVMELLEGLPLSQLLKHGGAVSTSRAINLIKGVLAGLSEAHEHGVVHRDLKPANVFVTRARTGAEVGKVLDFGIAKDTRQKRQADLTAASMLIGTPKYMAPEQFLKEPPDGRTDLYAVGLLLYQMLAGKPPFLADMVVPDTIATMPPEFRIGWMHINQLPTPLELLPGLWGILTRLLAKMPDDRFDSADDVIEALVAIEHSGRIPEPLPTVASGVRVVSEDKSGTTGFPKGENLAPVEPPARRKTGLAMAALVVVGLAGAGAWLAMGSGDVPEPPRPAAAKVELCVDEVLSAPTGAIVRQGSKALGLTPLKVERPCREVWMITLERDAHRTARHTLRGRTSNGTVTVTLQPNAPAAPATAAPATAAPATVAPATAAAKPRRARTAPQPARKPARKDATPAARRTKVKKPAPKAPAKASASKADDSLFF